MSSKKTQVITDLFEYEQGNDFGWGINTDTGGRLIVAMEDGDRCATDKNYKPRYPDIIGAAIKSWDYYLNRDALRQKRELVLMLNTSKGIANLSVYRCGGPEPKKRIRISIEDYA